MYVEVVKISSTEKICLKRGGVILRIQNNVVRGRADFDKIVKNSQLDSLVLF